MRLPVNRIVPLFGMLLLSACGVGRGIGDVAPLATTGPAADYPMVLGAPFVVDGVTYTPSDALNYDAVGIAAIDGPTGSAVTGAHRTLPLPSYAEVTSLASGKTILVRIERRGPMTGNRLIELSPGAAAQLSLAGQADKAVRVRRVNPPEVDRAMLRSGQSAPARMNTPASLLAVLMRKLDAQRGTTATLTSPAPQGAATASSPATVQPIDQPVGSIVTALPTEAAIKPATNGAGIARTAKAADASLIKGFVVQVGAFSGKTGAEATARKVGGQIGPSGKLWHVRIGPFATQAQAQAALVKAKAAGYRDARIQRAD